MPKTLIVTNDFPPRQGGIEAFVSALADRFPADEVVVYTSSEPGDHVYDAGLTYPVIRDKARTLLPTRRIRNSVIAAMTDHGCDRVLIGSSVPLGLLSPALREAGAQKIVAITHGHEVWWARLPGTRSLLRKVGEGVDVLTYISGWCRDEIGKALTPAGRKKQLRLAPGVDSSRFFPGCGGDQARFDLGIGADTPLVVCAARLIKRKGQDMLIKSWPQVLRSVPDAQLVIVGRGPDLKRLNSLVSKFGLESSVTFTGAVAWNEIPPYFDAATVFAMPSRTRLFGLEPEGLGIVFLEAASCEKPVVVGRSGGAPDAVENGVTGVVVDPTNPSAIAEHLVTLLSDPARAQEMGRLGRERAQRDWQWDHIAKTCREYLGTYQV